MNPLQKRFFFYSGRKNYIGLPGGIGFGAGVTPKVYAGFSPMPGTLSPSADNYGNYQYKEGSICCWKPFGWLRIGHVDNPTYPTYGVNSVDIKPESAFQDDATANLVGYFRHRAFIDGGENKRGFFRDKYDCSKQAWGTGFIASSIKNGLPISTAADHNPIADLTACAGNYYYETINAAHARDGVDGAINPDSIWFEESRFVASWLALVALAHGQAATGATYCAWFDPTYNFPKGNNNNALGDVNDATVSFTSDGYSNCAQAGSGVPFAKTTDNGQNCGVADVGGNVWRPGLGLTCIAVTAAIEGITSAATPVFTWTAHGLAVGDFVQLNSIAQADWLNLSSKMWKVDTVPTADTYTLTSAPDTSAYAAYDPVADGGTATKGTFYVAKTTTAMKDFTPGVTTATDHWGATGVAAMMEAFTPAFATTYPSNGYAQMFGNGANQVLSDAISNVLTGLGIPIDGGVSTVGTNLFGTDYYYQHISNQLCVLSGGYWSNGASAGVLAAYWGSNRGTSYYSVGAVFACYPE